MKVLSVFRHMLVMLLLVSCASKSSLDNNFSLYGEDLKLEQLSSSTKGAHLVLFRSEGTEKNNAEPANIFVNGRYLSTLHAQGYSDISVCSGTNELYITPYNEAQISENYTPREITVESGKTYFLALKPNNDKYEWSILNEQEAALQLHAVKKQIHTINRYSEDCDVRLAKVNKKDSDNIKPNQIDAVKAADVSAVGAVVASNVVDVNGGEVPMASVAVSNKVVDSKADTDAVHKIRILFPFAKFDYNAINSEGRDLLIKFSNDYKKMGKNSKIKLSGHADPIGNSDANLLLSQQRVRTVKIGLMAQGIRANFDENYMGSNMPIINCSIDKNYDDLGDIVVRSQKQSGIYRVQVYAGFSEKKAAILADDKFHSNIKSSVVVKRYKDDLVRVLVGNFSSFEEANTFSKSLNILGSFVRFLPKNIEYSEKNCNQPNRRVDVEIVE